MVDNATTAVVRELIRERRSEKRWQNIRFFIGFLILALIAMILFVDRSFVSLGGFTKDKGYVALLRMEGVIEPGREFSAQELLPRLRDAFTDDKAKGVVIDINSGGGTPVQAAIIHDAIIDLKKRYKKKVVVVGEDIMASGAYYVAVAADKIYVNPNTMTGSIGVIMKGFGFPDVIKKIGVERRVYTSGINKDRLDPFLPPNTEDIEKIRTVIGEVHENFNQAVIKGRQGRLRALPKELFTGDFWSGQTAMKLGLVDALGNLPDVLRSEFQVSRYRDYSSSPGIMKTFMSQFGMALGMALGNESVQVLEKM